MCPHLIFFFNGKNNIIDLFVFYPHSNLLVSFICPLVYKGQIYIPYIYFGKKKSIKISKRG